jgi:hypothetical protein
MTASPKSKTTSSEARKQAQKATTPAKRRSVPPLKKKAARSPEIEPMYTMPLEVKNWIERAQSTINHQKGEIQRLKQENEELKSYKKWAEHRILRSEHE